MSDIQQQIAHLQAENAGLETELMDLEAEVLDIERELGEFTERYEQLVQPMVTRLEIVRDAIAELERQQQIPPPSEMAAPQESTWQPPSGYVPVEEQFRKTWKTPRSDDPRPLESSWKPPSGYVSVEEQFRQRWNKSLSEPGSPITPGSLGPISPSSTSNVDLKRLYRQLARRYHPDLTPDPVERERRNRLMAEINEAYTQQDAAALQALEAQPENASLDVPLATIQLRQLQQVNFQLGQRLTNLKRIRIELLNSDLMSLKIKASMTARRGLDLLQEMADELEQEYTASLRRLDELRGL